MPFSDIDSHRPVIKCAPWTTIFRWLPLLVLSCLILAVVPSLSQERATVHKVIPVYPPIAKQLHITGTVVVTITVDATGKVIKADSTSGNKLLVGAAIEAVKQWKFSTGDGATSFSVSVNFE